MAFDYKKEFKEYYKPCKKPSIIEIPKFNYIAVRGKGDPNQEDSEYKASIQLLYPIIFTINIPPPWNRWNTKVGHFWGNRESRIVHPGVLAFQ